MLRLEIRLEFCGKLRPQWILHPKLRRRRNKKLLRVLRLPCGALLSRLRGRGAWSSSPLLVVGKVAVMDPLRILNDVGKGLDKFL